MFVRMSSRLMTLLVLSLIALLTVAVTSCGDSDEPTPAPAPAPAPAAAPAAAPAPATQAAPASADGPQLGGTYTYGGVAFAWKAEPKSWDISEGGSWAQFHFARFYQSVLLYGGVEEYGPRGSNEYAFTAYEALPSTLLVGDLAESYTIDAEKIEYKLREGVMWQGNDNIGMAPRELTAEDVAFSQNYYAGRGGGEGKLMEGYYDFADKMYAKDKYTFVVETNRFNFLWDWPLAWGVGMYPPEVMEAGAEKWENQVSSGPFVLSDYQKGVQVIYEKNPDYYLTTNIDGKDYPIPLIDKLVLPIIHDDAAQIAALRTGKIDAMESVQPEFKGSVSKSSPDIVWNKWFSGGSKYVSFLSEEGSRFADSALRRAMAVGTDREAIKDTIYLGEGELHTTFGPGSSIHTPLADLPAETKMLFEYDPDKAKQMLADAGYPDGLEMELWIDAGDTKSRDIGDLLVEQWGVIGVEATLVPLEHTAFGALRSNHEYKDAIILGDGIWPIEFLDKQYGTADNGPNYNDDHFTNEFLRAGGIVDDTARNKALADLAIYYVNENPYMQLTANYVYSAWWPWVKNFYGETDTGYADQSQIIARIWIDQTSKK